MANLQNFRIETEFTAPRQLIGVYNASISTASRYLSSGELGVELASTTFDVPAGVYYDSVVLDCSIDGLKRLCHQHIYQLSSDPFVTVTVSVSRISGTRFSLRAYATNRITLTSSAGYTVPAFTASVALKLMTAPF